ncbi:hypothetical protein FRC08_007502 [Ceratobasidium sp. 394]|nr:hypothetical protein FRC08_007502 [Ceratobasidium sp. 394]
MFRMGNQNALAAQGVSVDNPIKLSGVSTSEFESFLIALYSHECSKCDNQPFMRRIQSIEPDRIRSALRLADMWDFVHHRAYLLEMAFNTFDIVDQIELAEQFNVRDRVPRLYLKLCQRHEPLTIQEARKLGLGGTALVGRLRERLCRRVSPPIVPRPGPSNGVWGSVIVHAAAQRLASPEELHPLPSGEADAQFLKKGIQDWFIASCRMIATHDLFFLLPFGGWRRKWGDIVIHSRIHWNT